MAENDRLLAIDVGTTAVKAVVVAPSWRLVGTASIGLMCRRPRPGRVEQDPPAIARAVGQAGAAALAASGPGPSRLAGLALAFQRSTCLLMDPGTGEALSPAINWQCLRACADVEEMERRGLHRTIRRLTGLPLRPYWAGPKLAWLWRRAPATIRRRAAAVTLDAYIIHRLTGGRVLATDPTIASRTLLYDPRPPSNRATPTGHSFPGYSVRLRRLFGLEGAISPEVRPTISDRGQVSRRWQRSLPGGLPILASVGDQQAALVGCRGWKPGSAALTFGTGAFLLSHEGASRRRAGRGYLPTCIVDGLGRPAWGLEGGMATAGACLAWLDRLARHGTSMPPASVFSAPIFVPSMAGMGPPWHEPDVRGLITGLSPEHGASGLRLAVLDGVARMACELVDGLEQMRGGDLRLVISGGLLREGGFAELLATVLGRTPARAAWDDATALGTAILGARGAGLKVPARVARPRPVRPPRIDRPRQARRTRAWRAALTAARRLGHS